MIKKLLFLIICLQVISISGFSRALVTQQHDIRAILIETIKQERKFIDFAMYMLTDSQIVAALIEAHVRGVKVRVVLDQASRRSHDILASNGIPVCLHVATGSNNFNVPLMHNKFVVFGHNATHGLSVAWTGSFNCTPKASKLNDENALITDDRTAIAVFREAFQSMVDRINPTWRTTDNIDPEITKTISI